MSKSVFWRIWKSVCYGYACNAESAWVCVLAAIGALTIGNGIARQNVWALLFVALVMIVSGVAFLIAPIVAIFLDAKDKYKCLK